MSEWSQLREAYPLLALPEEFALKANIRNLRQTPTLVTSTNSVQFNDRNGVPPDDVNQIPTETVAEVDSVILAIKGVTRNITPVEKAIGDKLSMCTS